MGTSIDPRKEEVLSLREMARKVGLGYQSMLYYVNPGRLNRFTGKRVRLESIEMPAGRATSVEAFYRFIDRLNERDGE